MLPDEHVDVILSAHVGTQEAAALNLQNGDMEALLILHTSLGKDQFITIDGTWGQSYIFFPCGAHRAF